MSSNPLSERLRFAEFVLDRLPNGRCRARVALTWRDSEAFSGESEGLVTSQWCVGSSTSVSTKNSAAPLSSG